MKLTIQMNQFERLVFDRLSRIDPRTYVVGGAVRDTLLSKTPHDIDISTALTPEQVMNAFQEYRINPKGLLFGTIEIIFGEYSVEVTTLKDEVIVGRETEVYFGTSVEKDALFRDFTINALYVDPEGNLIDPLGGLRDLKEKILRPTPTFVDRLISDPVLAFRTARFVAQGYTPSAELIEILSNPKYHIHIRFPTPSRLARETQKAIDFDFKKYLQFLHETGALYYQMKVLEKYRELIGKALLDDDPLSFLAQNAIEVLQSLHVPPQYYMKYRFLKRKKPAFNVYRY